MTEEMPQTSAEVPEDVALDVLLAEYQRHLVVRAGARARASQELDAGLARHALAALSLGQAVVDDITTDRWPAVRDGLTHGATVAAVSAALGGLGGRRDPGPA